MTHAGGRDRYLDTLRAVAIARVVVFHMFGFAWLSYAFPAMGVMFALGGSLMAASMRRSATRAIQGRLRRLLPALWAMGLILVPVMLWRGWTGDAAELLLWAVPIADPPGAEWAADATVVLWYLATYLWLVLLSPAAWWLFRRLPLVAVLLPLALLAVTQLGPISLEGRAGAVLVNVATFAACWIAGFAHRTGALRRMSLPLLLALSAAGLAAGAGWALTHPAEGGSANLNDIPLAQALYSLGFVLPVLRLSPSMAWLRRFRPLDALVTLLNARAVTIYLWHNAAIAVCFPIGDRLEVWRLNPALVRLGYFGVALVLLTVVAVLLGWVEDVAAKRRPRLLPLGAARPRHVTSAPHDAAATDGGGAAIASDHSVTATDGRAADIACGHSLTTADGRGAAIAYGRSATTADGHVAVATDGRGVATVDGRGVATVDGRGVATVDGRGVATAGPPDGADVEAPGAGAAGNRSAGEFDPDSTVEFRVGDRAGRGPQWTQAASAAPARQHDSGWNSPTTSTPGFTSS
ncbi:acyltransferase [Dactylosporangium sp. NPDC000555]|uniref:acyltransferase family protein n=1 Tax=Dactylosporangium sp. NPDC000555 TaxID=3154260 RepID=UPI00331937FC